MADEEAKDELEVSKGTVALVIETAVHALSRDAIERVMMAIHQEDQYRWQIGAAAKSTGGDVTDEVIGQAINRTLVREGIGESFYPFFTSEVIKAIIRQRTRGGSPYGRDAFRHDFAGLARALECESLDITEDGELRRPGPAEKTHDVSWVDDFDPNVLDAIRDLLEEIKRKHDLDIEADVVTIIGHWPKDYGLVPNPTQQDGETKHRMALLTTLQQRKVVSSFRYAGVRGSWSEIEVEADRQRVRVTITAITDFLEGRRGPGAVVRREPASVAPPRSSLPLNQQAALTPETATSAPVRPAAPSGSRRFEEFGRDFGKGVAGELGKRTGTLIAVMVGLIILAAVGTALNWWGKATRWMAERTRVTQTDTTRTK